MPAHVRLAAPSRYILILPQDGSQHSDRCQRHFQYQTSSWPLQSMSVIDVVRGGCLVGDPRLKFDVIACVRPSRRFRIQWTEYNIHAEIALRGVRT